MPLEPFQFSEGRTLVNLKSEGGCATENKRRLLAGTYCQERLLFSFLSLSLMGLIRKSASFQQDFATAGCQKWTEKSHVLSLNLLLPHFFFTLWLFPIIEIETYFMSRITQAVFVCPKDYFQKFGRNWTLSHFLTKSFAGEETVTFVEYSTFRESTGYSTNQSIIVKKVSTTDAYTKPKKYLLPIQIHVLIWIQILFHATYHKKSPQMIVFYPEFEEFGRLKIA